jgi:hypothetical protein
VPKVIRHGHYNSIVAERDIRDVLLQRSDLSSFLVHFTRRTEDGKSAHSNLKRILRTKTIEARNAFGPAKSLRRKDRESQQCVSFSEVPLEHIDCLTFEIPRRRIRLSPFGLAFSKMRGRERGANPVWYVDITPGHDFLTKAVNEMIEASQADGGFRESPLARICPFMEQMGTGTRCADGENYQKEFWWEREWRHVGDFHFGESDIAFGFAPVSYIEEFEKLMRHSRRRSVRFVDPRWSTERMIGHLARYRGVLSPFDREPEL